jgi:hypothetical protein
LSLKEALALWGERGRLRVVRADAGFFDYELLTIGDRPGNSAAVE